MLTYLFDVDKSMQRLVKAKNCDERNNHTTFSGNPKLENVGRFWAKDIIKK